VITLTFVRSERVITTANPLVTVHFTEFFSSVPLFCPLSVRQLSGVMLGSRYNAIYDNTDFLFRLGTGVAAAILVTVRSHMNSSTWCFLFCPFTRTTSRKDDAGIRYDAIYNNTDLSFDLETSAAMARPI
jgi:hypothetical protein